MDIQINAILKLSKIGSQTLKLEKINMNELVREQFDLFEHQLEEHNTKIKISDLPKIIFDHLAMEQIVGNLIGNAIKFLQHDRKGVIEISAESQENNVVFHISDNGRGIEKKDLSAIFNIFKRVGKQNTEGEGMGLAYVKTLINLNGGQIDCQSEIGKGTTFNISIRKNK